MEYGVYVNRSTLNGEPAMILLCLYVDDLLVTGSSNKTIIEFKEFMKDEFEMTDLGKLSYFMSMEFAETEEDSIWLIATLQPFQWRSMQSWE